MTGKILLGLTATCSMFTARTEQREPTEWVISYSYNADKLDLPRVLLIGDSICNGYQAIVRDELAGSAYTTFLASSKSATDQTHLKELSYILDEYEYSVIHFNNGLHSLTADNKKWEKGLRAAVALIKEKAPNAKIIWATSTPLQDSKFFEKIKELNSISKSVMCENNIPVNDLYELMDPMDRNKYWVDRYHYNDEAREIQGKKIAGLLFEALGRKKASGEEAEKALKGAESETGPDGKLK